PALDIAPQAPGHSLIDGRVDENSQGGDIVQGAVKSKNAFDNDNSVLGGRDQLSAHTPAGAHVVHRNHHVLSVGQFQAGIGTGFQIHSLRMVEIECAVLQWRQLLEILVKTVGG